MRLDRLLRFEGLRDPLAPRVVFLRRLARHVAIAIGLLAFSLALGMLGYMYIAGDKNWIDAFYSASMLLGGMGPANTPVTAAGKLFAGIYSLYSGLVFLVAAAVIIAPLFHRVMHHFHLEPGPEED
jgi:hypothetical protein